MNKTTDRFLFHINKNIGICGLEQVGSISTGGLAQGVTTIKIEVKIYALVANYNADLIIIEVSDPYNPVLVSSIATGGNAYGVTTIKIEVKIYALLANSYAGL